MTLQFMHRPEQILDNEPLQPKAMEQLFRRLIERLSMIESVTRLGSTGHPKPCWASSSKPGSPALLAMADVNRM